MTSIKSSGRRKPLNLFLAEMIIALLFFSISGAVILKVFSGADHKSRSSARLERVVILAQSIAEAYSVYGNVDETAAAVNLSSLNSEFILENDQLTIESVETRDETTSGTLSELKMSFIYKNAEVYTLTCSAYVHKNGDG